MITLENYVDQVLLWNPETSDSLRFPCLFWFSNCDYKGAFADWVTHVKGHLGDVCPPDLETWKCVSCMCSLVRTDGTTSWDLFLNHVLIIHYGNSTWDGEMKIMPDRFLVDYLQEHGVISNTDRYKALEMYLEDHEDHHENIYNAAWDKAEKETADIVKFSNDRKRHEEGLNGDEMDCVRRQVASPDVSKRPRRVWPECEKRNEESFDRQRPPRQSKLSFEILASESRRSKRKQISYPIAQYSHPEEEQPESP
jgi:hypothetical protein